MNTATYIGNLIEYVGCDCDHAPDGLEDHTCMAGLAETEWRNLDAERERLRAEVKRLRAENECLYASGCTTGGGYMRVNEHGHHVWGL